MSVMQLWKDRSDSANLWPVGRSVGWKAFGSLYGVGAVEAAVVYVALTDRDEGVFL